MTARKTKDGFCYLSARMVAGKKAPTHGQTHCHSSHNLCLAMALRVACCVRQAVVDRLSLYAEHLRVSKIPAPHTWTALDSARGSALPVKSTLKHCSGRATGRVTLNHDASYCRQNCQIGQVCGSTLLRNRWGVSVPRCTLGRPEHFLRQRLGGHRVSHVFHLVVMNWWDAGSWITAASYNSNVMVAN